MDNLENQVSNIIEDIVTILTTYGFSVVGAVIILILGFFIAGRVQTLVEKSLARSNRVDEMLRGFISSSARYAILAITFITVLNQFGVQTASLIAVLGAAGLAIGLALQGTLSNVAAGVMLLLFRPFKIGDFVTVCGQSGTIKQLTLFLTELATPDNVQIIIPNAQVWGASLTNFSHHKTRRLDLVLGISYDDNIGLAKAAIEDEIAKDSRCHKEPSAVVAVNNLGDSSVDFTIRVWCEAGDYWALKWDLTRALKERMDAESISIPFPQTVIHNASKSD